MIFAGYIVVVNKLLLFSPITLQQEKALNCLADVDGDIFDIELIQKQLLAYCEADTL
jgi:hypothetical protein